MDINVQALRISPRYTSRHWAALSRTSSADWPTAAAIVRDRLEGRFLKFADSVLVDPFSGFVVLAIDSLLAETIQQFRTGDTTGKDANGRGRSKHHVIDFLSGPRFQPAFDRDARVRFYEDIRCGLLHQAEAKEMWLVRRGEKAVLQRVASGKGYVLDVKLFHDAVRQTLEDYLRDVVDPSHDETQVNLWTKMDHICRIREARGLLYEANDDQTESVEST
jgi:hypothetical protein